MVVAGSENVAGSNCGGDWLSKEMRARKREEDESERTIQSDSIKVNR